MGSPHRVRALPGGARLVTESMPERHSTSVVFMFAGGSRLEDERLAGVSHFIEHLYFKGTRRRPSSKEIADAILEYADARYRLPNLVIGAAGSLDDDDTLALVSKGLSLREGLDGVLAALPPSPLDGPRVLIRRRETEQAHICLGARAFSYLHPDRYALDLLNTVLGEGMSSRLFLNIRERLGLAYDVHSFTQKHRDTGYLGVYIGVDPKKAVDAVNAAMAELRSLGESEVSADELARAKEFTKGRLRLELETTNGVAFWLTYQEVLLGEIKSIEEELALVDAVTAADVKRVADELLSGTMQMSVIGPFSRDSAFRLAIGA